MMRIPSFILPAALAVLAAMPASSAPLHTRVRLLADSRSLIPGTHVTLGLHLTMDRGWHTYWKNSGEAGLPTQVHWSLPPGYAAGDIAWPVPQKHVEAGDVLTYGYGDETLLMVQCDVPAGAVPGTTVTLRARVEWLECEKICVPGAADVALALPVVASGSAPDNAALFGKFRKQLPPAFTEGRSITLSTRCAEGAVTLTLAAAGSLRFDPHPAATPDFYPEPLSDLVIGRTTVQRGDSIAELKIPLTASRPISGPLTMQGILLYTLAGGERRAESVHIDLPREFIAGISSSGSSIPLLERTFSTAPAAGSNASLPLYLLFALLGGLLLNIMPCVLPVIALKVFGLVRMAGDAPARIIRLGWAFSLGILASFLTLALLIILLQFAGQQVGWGFQFQEPLFVIAMAAVVFAFGLNLFGVFEIRLPGAAVSGLSSMASRQDTAQGGYGASFGEGVFATILATPCTAPYLGSALGFAFVQPWWVILLVFSTVALGMALPYLVLTARPRWLKYLPKPGEWMVTVKQLMGFLMMATLLWLLYVLGKQLGMEAVIWTGAFLLTVGAACWLMGRFATLTASRRAVRVTWLVALLLVGGGYELFLDAALNVRAVIAGIREAPVQSAEGIAWKPFSLEGLESDLKGDRPVFIDFTAEWCLTCKVNEKAVMSDRVIVEKFKELNVIPVRADWTNRNPDITRLLAKFGRSGVPLYVVFPPGKPDAPQVLPEVITVSLVVDALDHAAGRR
jgi:thiol:disulfide interchange protein DsbD